MRGPGDLMLLKNLKVHVPLPIDRTIVPDDSHPLSITFLPTFCPVSGRFSQKAGHDSWLVREIKQVRDESCALEVGKASEPVSGI